MRRIVTLASTETCVQRLIVADNGGGMVLQHLTPGGGGTEITLSRDAALALLEALQYASPTVGDEVGQALALFRRVGARTPQRQREGQ